MHILKIYFNFRWLVLLFILLPVSVLGASKASSGKAASKYQYVTDNFVIMMRTGQSSEHRIIRTLESGAKLHVVQSGKKYTKVKTENGDSGWVLSQYLSNEPAARLILPPIKAKLEKLESENSALAKSLKEITRERDALKNAAAALERLEAKHKSLVEESVRLKDAANRSTNLSETSKDLTRKNATLESQLDLMMRELRSLRDGSNRLWFLSGAGVILIGIVIGVMAARTRKEKKSSWGSNSDSLVLR